MSQLTKIEDNVLNRIEEMIQKGNISNNCLLQLIELSGDYLNIQTIPNYAKNNSISYNGAKNHRNIKKIFGVKFVIDND
jgi:hypothetical protein